jgi:hypothetical protein
MREGGVQDNGEEFTRRKKMPGAVLWPFYYVLEV